MLFSLQGYDINFLSFFYYFIQGRNNNKKLSYSHFLYVKK